MAETFLLLSAQDRRDALGVARTGAAQGTRRIMCTTLSSRPQ